MTTTIPANTFSDELLLLLSETFETVHGFYLDGGTSLLETLAEISAEEASIPVGNKCATIAAQVTHICFFLDVLDRFIQTGVNEQADWGEVWRSVRGVTPAEWAVLQERLRQTYVRIQATIKGYDHWEVEHSVGGSIALIAHTAYHLGEIRQATCIVKK